jgi:hypothetical protein
MRKVFLFVMFISGISCFGQDWLKYYGYGQQPQSNYCIEQYDRGYILSGSINNNKYGWVIKTDINGNKLWDLKIGNGITLTGISNIEQTEDNGFILCGTTTMFNSPHTDPFILKLNSCGELEWCKGLVYDNTGDGGINVKQSADGGYILLAIFFGNDPDNRIRLFKFDSVGNLKWYKIYNRDSNIASEDVRSLLVDTASCLITGSAYTPNWLRPYFIQTDTAGNENWRLIYSQHTGLGFVGDAYVSARDRNGNYYAAGRRSASPELLKFSSQGNEMMNTDLFPTATAGGAASLVLYKDTNCIMCAGWVLNGLGHLGLIKTDTFGSVQIIKDLPFDPDYTIISWTTKTFDSKLITILTTYFTGSSRITLIKVNSDLEYDSVYTQHFTYDSLCSHPIVSDTIVPDCGILVSVDEPFVNPESVTLKVYPNPTDRAVTIDFPKHIVVKNGNSSFGSTTVYEKWKSTLLEVFNLSGERVFQKEIIRSEPSLELNVSSWPAGMYYFKLSFKGQTVAGEKVVVK